MESSQPLDKLTTLDTFLPGNGSNWFWLKLLHSNMAQPAPLSWVFTECLTQVSGVTGSHIMLHWTKGSIAQQRSVTLANDPGIHWPHHILCLLEDASLNRRNDLWNHSWGASTEMLPIKDGAPSLGPWYTLHQQSVWCYIPVKGIDRSRIQGV